MSEPLFIYGTLHPRCAPAEIAPAVGLLRSLGPATILGKLLNLGSYPGLFLPGNEIVRGELFSLPDDRDLCARTLQALDAYEDFRPESPQISLFTRVLTRVTLPDGESQSAWVYVFNQAI